jgi:hypothetical protein
MTVHSIRAYLDTIQMTLGKNENEGNVVAFDFQMSGHGLACLDVECLFSRSIEFANYYEVEEIIRGMYF